MKKTLPTPSFLCVAAFVASSFVALPAYAIGGTEPLVDILHAPGSAGLGFATRIETSAYVGGGTRYDLLPVYLYEGERLFLHANRVGIKLINQGDRIKEGYGQRLDLFVEQRLEGHPIGDKLPVSLAGMAPRESAIDAGLSYKHREPWGTLQAELVHDVSSTYRGTEARFGYSYDWRSGAFLLRPTVSVSYRDAKLNNYYYGVTPGEATATRPAYMPGSGSNTQIGLYGSYDVSKGWRLLGGVSATYLGAGIKNSPIVQKRVLPAVYIGAAYDFGGHKREWAEENTPTYFKALYGRASQPACHLARIITARCASLDNVNPTSIAGVQVGKPFITQLNGWPLDFAGYLGVTHHNDRGLQSNGTQLDAFMKASYTGFPWSDRVKTRLGLGVGLSLAQRVPYTEVSSQAGKTTSKLLNYLDPTIDVSLGDLVGARALKETYFGFGVSHRSGIFGASRLLGSVAGGSNYIYTYLETAL